MLKKILVFLILIHWGSHGKDLFSEKNSLSNRFFSGQNDSKEEELLQEELSQEENKISLNFIDIDVRDLLSTIGEYTDTKIIIDDSVVGNVSVSLYDVSADKALSSIVKLKHLNMTVDNGIIFVSKTNKDQGCSYNNIYYPIGSILEINGRFSSCKIVNKGELFSNDKSYIWQTLD